MNKPNTPDSEGDYTVAVPFRRPERMGRDTLPSARSWGPVEVFDLSIPVLARRDERPIRAQQS